MPPTQCWVSASSSYGTLLPGVNHKHRAAPPKTFLPFLINHHRSVSLVKLYRIYTFNQFPLYSSSPTPHPTLSQSLNSKGRRQKHFWSTDLLKGGCGFQRATGDPPTSIEEMAEVLSQCPSWKVHHLGGSSAIKGLWYIWYVKFSKTYWINISFS